MPTNPRPNRSSGSFRLRADNIIVGDLVDLNNKLKLISGKQQRKNYSHIQTTKYPVNKDGNKKSDKKSFCGHTKVTQIWLLTEQTPTSFALTMTSKVFVTVERRRRSGGQTSRKEFIKLEIGIIQQNRVLFPLRAM